MMNIKIISNHKVNADIMYIGWQDYDPFMKMNFERQFLSIIDQIKTFHIKYLIIDSSCRKHDPTYQDFKEIFELFFSGLSDTDLKKVARICSPHPVRNARFQISLDQIIEALKVNIKLRNFDRVESALNWLALEVGAENSSR